VNEECLAKKGHKSGQVSEKCSRTEAFSIDSTPGVYRLLVSACWTVSDEKTRRNQRPLE